MVNFKKKRKAFSHLDTAIAITLLTVFVLVFLIIFANYSVKTQITSLLKKNYVNLSQVIVFSEAENGDNQYWDLPKSNEFKDMEIFLGKYYLPFFEEAKLVKSKSYQNFYKIIKDENDNLSKMITNYIVLKDDSILSFYYNAKDKYMLLFADINGISKPNRVGHDIFVYCIYNGKYHMATFLEDNNNIGDIKYLMSDTEFGCNKNNQGEYKNYYCGRVIQLNDWKIPDKDYPL